MVHKNSPDQGAGHAMDWFLLILYSICMGAISTIAGLVLSAFAPPTAAMATWIGTTAALVIVSGVAAVPLLRIAQRRGC